MFVIDSIEADRIFQERQVLLDRSEQFRRDLEEMDSENVRCIAMLMFQQNQELSQQLQERTQECIALNAEVERFKGLYDRAVSK